MEYQTACKVFLFPLLLSVLLSACNEPAEVAIIEVTIESNDEGIGEGTVNDVLEAQLSQYAIEDFMGNVNYCMAKYMCYRSASWSPDNSKILVSHNRSGIYNVYSLSVEDGDEIQLTNSSTDAFFAQTYFNEDERFIYRADKGGNELAHLYLQEIDGTVVDLTPGENLISMFNGWAEDYQSFFVGTNERDQRFIDLYEYQISDGYPREMLFENTVGLMPTGLSNDGKYVVLTEERTWADNDLHLQNLETGESTLLTPHTGNVSSSPNDFSPDNQYLYYTTDEGSEYQHLMRYKLETGEKEEIVSAGWDVVFANFSKEGNYLVVGINAEAQTELRIYEADTMDLIELPFFENNNITSASFSHGDQSIAMYASGSRIPSDLFIQSLETASEPIQLTNSLNPNINPDDLVNAEVVYFASYDGVQIPGLLYKPQQATADNLAPALVMVHGGPGGQTRVGYNDMVQYFVNHGYAVYGINNRGSRGYGKTFFSLDNQKHGEADLGDVVASKQMLIDTGYVDPERIGIIGGSYGGYMVVAAMAFEPEVFGVGVDIFGVTNWLRTLESIPPWWETQREALYAEMGDPETDRERLVRISPLFHAENIVNPMMVLQGANDPRVLQVESDEIVAALRDNEVIVDYILFPDEGHGFTNRVNQAVGYKSILDFLERNL